MPALKGLGNEFDVLCGFTPVDLGTAGATGARVNMENYGRITWVGYLATGTAAQAPTFTLQEHTAATAGTSTNLAVITEYFQKEEATLDGDEAWTRVTQTAAATVTDADWDDANEVMVAFSVDADQLSDGYEWVSVNVADPGTAHIGCVFGVASDLRVQRAPQNLPQPNA
jgi:hypothetical protein